MSNIPPKYVTLAAAVGVIVGLSLLFQSVHPWTPQPRSGTHPGRPRVVQNDGSQEPFQPWYPDVTGDGGHVACIGAEGPPVTFYRGQPRERSRVTLCVQQFRESGLEIYLSVRPGLFLAPVPVTRVVHIIPELGSGSDVTVTLTPAEHGTSLRVTPVEPLMTLFRSAITVDFDDLPFHPSPYVPEAPDASRDPWARLITFYTRPLIWPHQ